MFVTLSLGRELRVQHGSFNCSERGKEYVGVFSAGAYRFSSDFIEVERLNYSKEK